MNTLELQSIVFIYDPIYKMLLTDPSDKKFDHPVFSGQIIWNSVHMEISAPYFLVESAIQEEDCWVPQTRLLFGLDSLFEWHLRLQSTPSEMLIQVALVSPANMNQSSGWQMHDLHEVWIAEEESNQFVEIYVTCTARLVYPPRQGSLNTLKCPRKILEFTFFNQFTK